MAYRDSFKSVEIIQNLMRTDTSIHIHTAQVFNGSHLSSCGSMLQVLIRHLLYIRTRVRCVVGYKQEIALAVIEKGSRE